MPHPVRLLRHIALAEGVSFLCLLCIAMPLKYVWGEPLAVLIAGSLHGALFVALVLLLLRARQQPGGSPQLVALVFAAALLPCGPFFLDGRMRAWANESKPAGQ
jgi:integral membrane protein